MADNFDEISKGTDKGSFTREEKIKLTNVCDKSIMGSMIISNFKSAKPKDLIPKYKKAHQLYYEKDINKSESIPLTMTIFRFKKGNVEDFLVVWKHPDLGLDTLLEKLKNKAVHYRKLLNLKIYRGDYFLSKHIHFTKTPYDRLKKFHQPLKQKDELIAEEALFHEFKIPFLREAFSTLHLKIDVFSGVTHSRIDKTTDFKLFTCERFITPEVIEKFAEGPNLLEYPVIEHDFEDFTIYRSTLYPFEDVVKDLTEIRPLCIPVTGSLEGKYDPYTRELAREKKIKQTARHKKMMIMVKNDKFYDVPKNERLEKLIEAASTIQKRSGKLQTMSMYDISTTKKIIVMRDPIVSINVLKNYVREKFNEIPKSENVLNLTESFLF